MSHRNTNDIRWQFFGLRVTWFMLGAVAVVLVLALAGCSDTTGPSVEVAVPLDHPPVAFMDKATACSVGHNSGPACRAAQAAALIASGRAARTCVALTPECLFTSAAAGLAWGNWAYNTKDSYGHTGSEPGLQSRDWEDDNRPVWWLRMPPSGGQ